MPEILHIKNKVTITYAIKFFLKKKKLKKNKQSVMFLRAPKHFKRGKQFLFFYSGYIKKNIEFNNLDTSNLIFLSHKYIYNTFFYTYLKSSIPEQTLKRVTLKYNVVLKF